MTELEFAQRLKEYRKARGMTQQELADRLGVSNKSVSRWETGGYPDVALLGPLAKALGVTVDDLLCDSLENARTAFDREAADILSDCTPWERTVITGTMRALKEHLRRGKPPC